VSLTDLAVTVERHINAAPATVYSFFTDPAKWLSWQGVDATIEPVAGGVFRMNVRGDGYASGQFVEVDPPRRIVFTWGWEDSEGLVAPGSSTVEIELVAEDSDSATLVRLSHLNLPAETIDPHHLGWEHYLSRLEIAATGGDPGPDPWCSA
jgi:uncharacterized protein YndB with AHSA1/START domain